MESASTEQRSPRTGPGSRDLATSSETATRRLAATCLHHLFEERAAAAPEATALVCGEHHLTYRELNERSNQLAHYMRKAGVGPDVLVGICMHRRVEMIVGLLATLKAGGAYVPLDASYPKPRLAAMLDEVRMQRVLTTADLVGDVPEGDSRLIVVDRDWQEIAAESRANPPHTSSPDDLAYVIFTSGSTGKAKAAGVPHRGWTNLLIWFDTEFNVTADDKVLVISSFSFDITQRSIMMPLIVGGQLHLFASRFYDPGSILHAIADAQITLMNCAPSTFYPLIEQSQCFRLMKSLRIVFLGGEAISASRLRAWAESGECRTEAVNVYGVAECSDVSSFHRLKNYRRYVSTSVPLGKPIFNSQVYVLDGALRPVASGTVGEICLAGAGVGRGYINDPALTARKFVPNPFADGDGTLLYRTGDLGRILADGTVEYRGRIDNQIKVRGMRVELGDIETALRQSPMVSEAVVVTRRYDDDDHRLVACVVPHRRLGDEELGARLRPFLRERLPEHLVPADFVAIEEMPLTPNGKVDRNALTALAAEATTITVGAEAPRTPLEKEIARIFAKVLKLDRVGVLDSFFDLGGNSFLVTELLSELAENMSSEVSILDFLAGPSVAQIAAVVENAAGQTRAE